MKNNKKYLSIDEQLNHLESVKNIKINIDRQKAYNLLKSESYGRLVTPYKDLLVVYNLDNTKQLEPWTKNRRILREYQQGLRVPIASKGRIKIKDILNPLKNYKIGVKDYTKEHKFGQLLNYKNINDKIVKILRKPIEDIELIIKSTISEFIGERCLSTKWYDWLLNIAKRPYRIINLLNNFWDKFNKTYDILDVDKTVDRYNNINIPIWSVMNEMTLGEIKEIILSIRYSKLDKEVIRDFFKTLFHDNLKLYVNLRKIDFDDLIWRLDVFINLRNALSHTEKLNTFLLKEKYKYLKFHLKGKEFRIWFVINNTKDKSIRFFLQNYNKFRNVDYHNITTNYMFNNLHFGYCIEVEDSESGNTYSVDLKILKILSWWFEK